MEGKYIYGIINSNNGSAPAIVGLGGSEPAYTIAHKGLACVLSDYSGEEFSSMSREEVIRSLLAHQVVVEHVMREHPVLPVRFGTVLATPQEVSQLLSLGYPRFSPALAWVQDKLEVAVAATWDLGQVLREISSQEEIVAAKEALASKPTPTQEERIRLGRMVKAAMDRRRDDYKERMISFLKPAAADILANPILAEDLVMNVAFLVEKANREEFEGRVKQLDDLFHNRINFRILGPLPPYSFATVEVARPSPGKIEEARRLLHLGGALSEPEVRKAYRRWAAQTHPDCRPGDEMAKAQFVELRRASQLLIAYCQGQAEAGDSLWISIKRRREEEVPHLPVAEIGWSTHG